MASSDEHPLDPTPPPSALRRIDQALDRRWLLVITLLLLAALTVRGYALRSYYPSMDEQWHLHLSNGLGTLGSQLPEQTLLAPPRDVTAIDSAQPIWKIWTNMHGVVHPPLYVLLLRLWREMVGGSDLAPVGFSIACSAAAVVMCAAAARVSFGALAGLLAGLMMTVAPQQVYFSTQIRAYALLTLLAAVLLYQLAGVTRDGMTGRRLVGIAASMLGMMLTHYFAIAVCFAAGIYLLTITRGRRRLHALIAMAVAALIYLAIWGPFALQQWREMDVLADSWQINAAGSRLNSVLLFLGSPSWAIFGRRTDYLLLFAIVGGVLLAAAARVWRRRESRPWLIWMMATPLMLVASDLIRRTEYQYVSRYLCASMPAAFGMVAGAAVLLLRKRAIAFCAVITMCTAGCLMLGEFDGVPRFDVITRSIAQHPDDTGQPIVFTNTNSVPWQAAAMVMDVAHNPLTRGRTVAWVQNVAPADFVASIPGETFWAAGVIVEGRAPEDYFPGTTRLRALKASPTLFVALLRMDRTDSDPSPSGGG